MRNSITIILLCALLLGWVLACKRTGAPTTPKAETAPLDKSAKKQEEREKLIAELQRKGVFGKIESVSPTHVKVWVKPRFYTLDFDDKQNFISVIFAYYFDRDDDSAVYLKDALTNKSVGRFSKVDGGLTLD